ncbi:MAG: PKD domain-containing protein [Crocinitomicaceae bacterium]
MKKSLLLKQLLIIFLFPFTFFGQVNDTSWVNMMADPAANFYDVQNAFNNYWRDKTIEKGKGYKTFKRWENYMEPRVYPSGDITLPSLAYPNYLDWIVSCQNDSTPTPLANWTPVGPIGAPVGGGAGRINFVRFDPTNSNTIYVGAPDGGLWKSTNGGVSWTTNTDQLTVIGCTDIAINPANTQTMYLATGDGEAGDSYSIGVLKSIDGGATWNTTGLTWAVSLGRRISRLLMHPTNPLILIAATTNGIYRTADGGTTWTQTSTGSFKDAEFSPGTANTVYAAGTIFQKSTDNGITWSTISSGLPTSGVQRIAIAVTPANNAYVYLLIGQSSDQGLLGIYRSTDSGATFSTQKGPTSPNLLGWNASGSDLGGQAFYDLSIAASPTAANTIIVGGVNTWRSTDGGVTWTLNSHWTGSSAPYVHADCHAIEYLPGSSTTYFIGCDGGIFKTSNSGTSFSDISANLQIAQQYRIGLSSNIAGKIVAGHQDNGTNLLNGGGWSQIYGGDGMDCFIDRTNNNTIYGSYVYGDYYKSTNGGSSWTTITTGLPGGSWLCPYKQDPVAVATLYAAGRADLYKSTNGGTSWSAVGTPSGTNNVLEFVVSPSNNQIIYAVKQNAISKSSNGGTSFTNVTGTLPTGTASLTNVTVSSTDPNIVWVTFSGYSATTKVFKSTNGGTSWVNTSTGLPNVPCNTIVYQNAAANDVVYVGTDVGVFFMDNTMSSWANYMPGLPRVSISDLEIYYPTSKIRAGTFGRGTWESDLASTSTFPPIADFTSPQTVCLGNTVAFTDGSLFAPTAWTWTFPGGTPSTSTVQNPVITYSTAGIYDVTLAISNANGADTIVKLAHISVLAGSGSTLPLTEGFTTATFPPTNWSVVNANNSSTWVRSSTIGTAPTAGNSMLFDNYNINDSDDDEMHVQPVSLLGLSDAKLTFDVAYAPYNTVNFDGLDVLVSTDCGGTFTTIYSKSNLVLATAPATLSSFTPTAAQWRSDTVDLTPYIGNSSVIVAFKNIANYGNRLFIDNINITGTTIVLQPTASFTGSPAAICPGQSVAFTNTSTGTPTSYLWTFTGGTPATSTAVNPTVTYAASGNYTVELTATNAGGSNTTTITNYITVNSTPSTPTISAGGPITFCSGGSVVLSSSSPTGNLWSTGATTQSITVPSSGTYTVEVTNAGCASSPSLGTTITVNPIPTAPTISTGGPTTFCAGNNVVLTSSAASGNLWSTGATTQSITVSTSGTFTVNTTALGCTSSNSGGTTITVNPVPTTPTISAGGPTTFCTGGSVLLTSSSATGNLWSTGATSQSITVPSAGTYTVAVTTAGCTSGNSLGTTITVNPIPTAPTISASGPTSFCSGGNVVLTSSASTGNIWSSGATTQSITVSNSGIYTVTSSNAGCTSAPSFGTSIIVNPIPVIAVGTITDPSICSTANGSIEINGAGSGNLFWSGTSSGSMNGTLPLSANGIGAGSYSFTFTSAVGCNSNTVSQVLNDPTPPATPLITASGPITFCDGNSVTLTSSSAAGNTWSTGENSSSITVNSSGNYSVTYTDGNGCSSTSNATNVLVNSLPIVLFDALENVCIYNPVIPLVQGSPAGGIYSGNGVTGSQFDPNLAGLGLSTLTYFYTDGNGCGNSAVSTIFVDGCAGIDEPTSSKLEIFPNPSTGILTINAGNTVIVQLIVFDYAGRKVAEQNGNSSAQLLIDLSDLANGMYTFEVISSNSAQRLPILIQH